MIDIHELKPGKKYNFCVFYNIENDIDTKLSIKNIMKDHNLCKIPYYYTAVFKGKLIIDNKDTKIWEFTNFTNQETGNIIKKLKIKYLSILNPTFYEVDNTK